ncbi:MAG: YeaH/YhbH family protein [Gammaproteobacteria bacterium]|nr:YeaH/YhbH family protein [Gammaproteobacteria bacterium]MBU1722553.1 YeaH/YhbH family protein [Gammaproteobacteria bacterium]MBU2004454.1 YeaH/YhbH family protein [Gammaproteobacteria bacterium]
MAYIVDRRLNSKNKSLVNRERFLKRYQKQIRRAVSDAVSRRNITDMEQGESITIPKRDISEPVFRHGQGGRRDVVHPGNKEFIEGDRIQRPPGGGGGGSGSGDASNSGDGMDDFVFQISQKEFLEYLFEDLALPNMVKRQLLSMDSFDYKRAGVSEVGNPAQINIVRSMRSAHARRIALRGKERRRRREVLAELEELDTREACDEVEEQRLILKTELEHLNVRMHAIPWLDDFDLKYNLKIKVPKPSPKAVMFCVMDVSGSMTQEIKDTAKRFFFLLYLFLKKNYEKIDVVFIRHHTQAQEVDEETFFYARETGGTVVSSALNLTGEIIKERFAPDEWNIYVAQASDGDNWHEDNQHCHDALVHDVLPFVQYYTYIEIGDRDPQGLWYLYEHLQGDFADRFAIQRVRNNAEIYPVFRELFKKHTGEEMA